MEEIAIDLSTEGRLIELGSAGYVYLRASRVEVPKQRHQSANMVRNVKGRIRFSKKAIEAFNFTILTNVRDITSGINVRTQPDNKEKSQE